MNQMAHLVSAIDAQAYGVPFEVKPRRREKNLVDAIVIAFHSACDLKDFPVAWRLLGTLENSLTLRQNGPDFDRRRALAVLVAGHERLWNLRHD
jgi:hypothetical protein